MGYHGTEQRGAGTLLEARLDSQRRAEGQV